MAYVSGTQREHSGHQQEKNTSCPQTFYGNKSVLEFNRAVNSQENKGWIINNIPSKV